MSRPINSRCETRKKQTVLSLRGYRSNPPSSDWQFLSLLRCARNDISIYALYSSHIGLITSSLFLCLLFCTQTFARPFHPKLITRPEIVFLGYTGKAAGTSEIISNLQEFRSSFGLPTLPTDIDNPDFILSHSLELFWKNGGGNVRILSIGKYEQEGKQKAARHFQTGLRKLQAYPAPQLLVLPEAILLSQTDYATVCKDALLHGKKFKRFALLDVQAIATDNTQQASDRFRSLVAGPNLREGAAYWPYVKLTDGPWIGASALVAGRIAENDQSKGVWKAPAGVEAVNADLIQFPLNQSEIESLQTNQTGLSINPLRSLPGKGIVIWGARTLAGNENEWRYVPVRRLALFLEKEATEILNKHTSSPNTSTTWKEVKKEMEFVLMDLFRKGAFPVSKASEAYYVKIGIRETMTQRDIDQGKMVMELGFAPLKPAEFVILKASTQTN